ncbi:hypothetical protein ACHAW6_009086 [Cyclotella cf. meneghiniana]
MNHCIPTQEDDNAVCADDATPFLSIIQTLPSNDDRPEEETTDGTIADGTVHAIPCNIFSDLTSTFSYDTAPVNPTQTNEWKRSESSSVCSILTEQRDCFELGRDAASPTRQLGLVDGLRVHAKLYGEGGEKFLPLPPLLDEITSGMVSKNDSFENGRTLDAVTECSKSTQANSSCESANPYGKSLLPGHEKESILKNKSDKMNDIEDNKILNSSIGGKERQKVHGSITSSSHEKVASKESNGGKKTKATSKFLKRLKSKLSSRVIATMDTAVEIAVEPEGSATARDGNENDNPSNPGAVAINGNSSMDPFLADVTSRTPQDVSAVREEETASEGKVLSYDEICYGTPPPKEAITLTPSPTDHFHECNSIVMRSTSESRKKEKSLLREFNGYEMPCNLSPILEEPSRERAARNRSLSLDATGSMTATPNDSDTLNLSRESAHENSGETSSSMLSDVSRTLFPEELEGYLADVAKEDTNYGASGDLDEGNDYEGLAIECTLQKNGSCLFDVTIEDVEVNDLVGLEKEGLHHCEQAMEKPKEWNINGSIGVVDSSKVGDRPKRKVNNIFQKDIFSFGDLFGCGASSSNAASAGI